ncbi:hypothetical protein H3T50_07480 [Commensalibacter sp. M0134]|uniref:SMODS domain-containing nucleotidyltransferase n=1 Tax=Commensalibacter TaxID=1079922 RepID=UPI0018DC07E0|nr:MULTISPECIES: hypothetical protein [Commensalibacter]MBI0066512.1 hypothetical protein [Commensalibacter sp. M0134]MBI0070457.1 hypothetical protein [Commensalibacter sp. M0133]MBI0081827.1 hypothetical protein [Commensalibacter melissae]
MSNLRSNDINSAILTINNINSAINTINSALQNLIKKKVNIQADVTKARDSRNFLFKQINNFSQNNSSMLEFAKKYDTSFGSFSRRTKIDPLDDIDLMIGLNGHLFKYFFKSYEYVTLRPKDIFNLGTWNNFIDKNNSGNLHLNSRKVLKELKRNLQKVPHYEKAEINLHKQAITLKLNSYPWTFDIVPCFYNLKDNYYFIPNGNGHWMLTNPKTDQDFITNINQNCSGKLLEIIRLFKYWNKQNYNRFPSYLLEIMIANFFKYNYVPYNNTYDFFFNGLYYLQENIGQRVKNSKDFEGNINSLDSSKIKLIKETIEKHMNILFYALFSPNQDDIKSSLIEIF